MKRDPRRIVDRDPYANARQPSPAPRVRSWIVSLRWVSPVGEVGGEQEIQVQAVDIEAARALAISRVIDGHGLGEDAQFRILFAREVGL